MSAADPSSFSDIWFQYVLDNPEKQWPWSALSNNPNATMALARKHPDLPWHWDKVACKFYPTDLGRVLDISAFAWSSVRDEDDGAVDWYWVSSHPSLTWQIVKENLHRPWDWSQISAQAFINWRIVSENPDLPWNWRALAANPMKEWRREWEADDAFLQKEVDLFLSAEAANGVD